MSFSYYDLNSYQAQTSVSVPGPYASGTYEHLRADALGIGKHVGSASEAYIAAIEGGLAPYKGQVKTGVLPVSATYYTNRVSPVAGWSGSHNSLPTSTPADPNTGISLVMDFNTMDLYTFENVHTPNADTFREKNLIYENAPIRHEWPQIERRYNVWGTEVVGDTADYGVCRPVPGWPLRLQRIPLCINKNNPLVALTGSAAVTGEGGSVGDGCSSSGSAGPGGDVSGYFYALVTDPVLFTDDIHNGGHNPTRHQWISEEGLLPLNTACGGPSGSSGGGFGSQIAGISCDKNTTFDCADLGCLEFSDCFGIEKVEEGDCGGKYKVFPRGLTISQPPLQPVGPCNNVQGGGGDGHPDPQGGRGIGSPGSRDGYTYGWRQLVDVTKDPTKTPATVTITYSYMQAGVGMDGPASVVMKAYKGDTAELNEAGFRNVIKDACQVWKDAFEDIYPWLTLNFVENGDETSNSVPSRGDPCFDYALPLHNIGDFRFGMHTIDVEKQVLAHAFFPSACGPVSLGGPQSVAGDVHFDKAETWRKTNGTLNNSIELLLVTVHEMGHSFGFDHCDDPNGIMFPQAAPNANFKQRWGGGLARSRVDKAQIEETYSLAQGNPPGQGQPPAGGGGAPLGGAAWQTYESFGGLNNIVLGRGLTAYPLTGSRMFSGAAAATAGSDDCGCPDIDLPQLEVSVNFPELAGYHCTSDGCKSGSFQNEFAVLRFNEDDFRIQWDAENCIAEVYQCDGMIVSGYNRNVASGDCPTGCSEGTPERAVNIKEFVFGSRLSTRIERGLDLEPCERTPENRWEVDGGGINNTYIATLGQDECEVTVFIERFDVPDKFVLRWNGPGGPLVYESNFLGGNINKKFQKPAGVTQLHISQSADSPDTKFTIDVQGDCGIIMEDPCPCDKDEGTVYIDVCPPTISGCGCVEEYYESEMPVINCTGYDCLAFNCQDFVVSYDPETCAAHVCSRGGSINISGQSGASCCTPGELKGYDGIRNLHFGSGFKIREGEAGGGGFIEGSAECCPTGRPTGGGIQPGNLIIDVCAPRISGWTGVAYYPPFDYGAHGYYQPGDVISYGGTPWDPKCWECIGSDVAADPDTNPFAWQEVCCTQSGAADMLCTGFDCLGFDPGDFHLSYNTGECTATLSSNGPRISGFTGDISGFWAGSCTGTSAPMPYPTGFQTLAFGSGFTIYQDTGACITHIQGSKGSLSGVTCSGGTIDNLGYDSLGFNTGDFYIDMGSGTSGCTPVISAKPNLSISGFSGMGCWEPDFGGPAAHGGAGCADYPGGKAGKHSTSVLTPPDTGSHNIEELVFGRYLEVDFQTNNVYGCSGVTATIQGVPSLTISGGTGQHGCCDDDQTGMAGCVNFIELGSGLKWRYDNDLQAGWEDTPECTENRVIIDSCSSLTGINSCEVTGCLELNITGSFCHGENFVEARCTKDSIDVGINLTSGALADCLNTCCICYKDHDGNNRTAVVYAPPNCPTDCYGAVGSFTQTCAS